MGRGEPTGLSGILAIDKPAGVTSHDVVDDVRRATGERRVGHAGTLDPMATGLLVVLVGPATRLEPYLSSAEKRYRAVIAFGSSTDTDDAEGSVTGTMPVHADILDTACAERILDGFRGEITQTPPAYSAIKIDGRVSHRVARAGGTVEMPQRSVTVISAVLEGIDPVLKTWSVRFEVSKGTYVRALARDIGLAAGTLAHLVALRRLGSGTLSIEHGAHTLERVIQAAGEGRLGELFEGPLDALRLPIVVGDPGMVADGRPLDRSLAPELPTDTLVSITDGQRFLAVYRVAEDEIRPETVIPGGIGNVA